jgi:sialate O-acetylesterase
LVNSEGLPTSVFPSDDWNDVEIQVDRSVSKTQAARRALAAEIKALSVRRETLDRKSPELKSRNKKATGSARQIPGSGPNSTTSEHRRACNKRRAVNDDQ